MKYARQANSVFNAALFDVSRLNDLEKKIIDKTFIIQTTDGLEQGSGFMLEEYGLITAYHVTQSDKFYNVLSYKGEKLAFFTKYDNLISEDRGIDYSLYSINKNISGQFKLGDSTKLGVGDRVIVAGYPNYQNGDSINIQTARISSKKQLFGKDFFTVDKGIFHGASGGVVLDEDYCVVGIIKGGVESYEEQQENVNQGFVPIHLAIQDIHEKRMQ